MGKLTVRLGIQQRVLPSYRVPFFDCLAEEFIAGLGIFAGAARRDEALGIGAVPQKAQFTRGQNIHTFKGHFYLCWQLGLLTWLRRFQPQVLIMEANPRYPFSYFAQRWMREREKPLIGWGLGSPYPTGSLADQRLRLRRWFVKRFDALITYSQQGAQEYANIGFPAEKVFVAPNAVAPKPVNPAPARPPKFRFDRPFVLYVGRLQPRKRVEDLIRACPLLPEELRPQLWIVGDGPYRYALEELATGVYPETRFCGAMHDKELEDAFAQADLFVLPGTGGLAVQQAMSFALPVVVGEADGTQSELVRAENGWRVPGGDVRALADTLKDALADVVRLRQKGLASYRIVKEEVNLENMVAAFNQAVRSVWRG